jgi:hypothetical protein
MIETIAFVNVICSRIRVISEQSHLHSELESNYEIYFSLHGLRPLAATTQNHSEAKYDYRSRGSSVSIVSDYGLDDRGSIPDRGSGFFF